MSKQLDDYGYFGPDYSFADNIPLPGAIGVKQDPSIGAVISSISAVNYYTDTIAFGGRTFFNKTDLQPMGLRYFLDTGMRCSNGATMSEYFDGVTKGDILGTHVEEALASAGLPGLKGLAPGMLESARDALDPRPIFAAVTATGYPVCQQVQCPVGDVAGRIQNINDATKPYIVDPVQYVNGIPMQTRWVQAYDATGSPINITKDEFGAQPKCYNADGTYMDNPPAGCVPPVAGSSQGADRFANCTVVQGPTMPPTLATEGFEDMKVSVGAAFAAAVLGGVALWTMSKRS